MATIDATNSKQPRLVHAGTITVKNTYSLTASLSAGDVLQLVKIPHGAIIEDIVFVNTVPGDYHVTIGDGGDADRFFTSATMTADAGVLYMQDYLNAAEGVGYQYNLSDDAAVQYDTIDMTVGTVTTGTAAGAITLLVRYHCDEADP